MSGYGTDTTEELNMKHFAKLALLVATLIWGTSFFIMKNAVDRIPTPYLLGIRFSVAAVLLALIFAKRLKQINKKYIWQSAIIGLCLYLAYYTQTLGLARTTPGKNAFLTAVYCIIVPFLYWIADKKKPGKSNVLAAVLCVGGIRLVSLTSNLTLGLGDALTLVGGFFYAAHIVVVAKFGKNKDMFVVTILQFAYCAVYAGITALILRPQMNVVASNALWIELAYLAVACTALALLLQNLGQKYTHPSSASLILSLESVFGVIFSVIFYDEKLTLRIVSGFVLIFAAIVISECFSPESKKKQE